MPRPAELDPAGVERVEHAVEDAAVVVGVAIERGAEAVHKADRPEARLRRGPGQLFRRWASTAGGGHQEIVAG